VVVSSFRAAGVEWCLFRWIPLAHVLLNSTAEVVHRAAALKFDK